MSLLTINNLTASYGDFQALFGISMQINKGETAAIIGSNGAGKSTFMKAISGLIESDSTSICLHGKPIGHLPAFQIVEKGVALVPEGRRLFSSLSVEENLLMGQYSKRSGPWNLSRIYQLFPVLEEKRENPGTALSGGQQQMVAIGRALLSNPEVLLCDEMSLGLAPATVKDIYAVFPFIKQEGMTVLVVEQDISQALAVADRVYCFQEGRISLEGKPNEMTQEEIKQAYFGV